MKPRDMKTARRWLDRAAEAGLDLDLVCAESFTRRAALRVYRAGTALLRWGESWRPSEHARMGRMKLPVMPPVSPMLAKSVASIPPGASYEPKWDGFRSICFRDFDEVELGSRNERPMTRYFPELVAAVTAELPERCVDRRRDRHRHRPRPGLRGAATAHPPGRFARADARRADTRLRSSRSTCSPSATTTTPGDRSASAAPPSSTRWPTPARRSTSRRRPPI